MRRIKDFFYDKNDILIVILILIVAAFIIYSRIGAIMDYPGESSSSAATEAAEETTVASDESAGNVNEDGEETISVKIEDEATAKSVSKALEDAGLVASASDFQSYIKDQGKESSLQTGTFDIPFGSTDEDILKIITKKE